MIAFECEIYSLFVNKNFNSKLKYYDYTYPNNQTKVHDIVKNQNISLIFLE